ncbi:hypothetical protein BGZ82_001724, partial [Podila clonocystis]
MVLGLDAPSPSAYYRFPRKDFVDLGDRTPGHEGAFKFRIGNSVFAHDELIIDLPASHYDRISDQELDAFYDTASQQYLQQFQNSKESQFRPLTVEYFRGLFPSRQELTGRDQKAFSIKAHFQFPASAQTPLPTSLLLPSIMGATAYLPFLECFHGVASVHHLIQRGQVATLSVNDNILSEASYDGGVGYLEKDWGINFPSIWIWAQSNVFKTAPGSSMLFSLASIPTLGPDFSDWVKKHLPFASGLTEWPGLLLVYYHAPSKTLYNFSSYVPTARLRSVKVSLDIDKGTQTVHFKATTRDPNWSEIALEANITRAIGGGIPLRTPSRAKGRMAIGVEEATTAHTTVRLWHVGSGEILVEDEGLGSGLEVEGNMPAPRSTPALVYPLPPVTAPPCDQVEVSTVATLVLQDGSSFQGISFGAETQSISGECVFQTGMVGYPESLTDPSYRGQILVLTFPLIGNYGVPSRELMDPLLKDLPRYFESNEIHIAGLIVGQYSQDFSHFLATSSLSAWLKEFNVPAIYGIDTRAMTKKIRSQGVMLGKILFPTSVVGPTVVPSDAEWMTAYQNVDWVDPNERNLVAEVSLKAPKIYSPDPSKAALGPNGKPLRILAVDVGMKYNQIRCFVARGVEVKVVPWDYDFNADTDYDGLFISNGPGDPTMTKVTIAHLKKALQISRTPIFGICLGHQLLALASGAKTKKMKFGNRGHNIPCTDMISGRCYISSQNHGYAVDVESLPSTFMELFVNANDGSNEGIMHKTLPIFSVQFHPESTPGPRDTEYLFDVFIHAVNDFRKTGKLKAITMPGGTKEAAAALNPRVTVRKVLVLGSGGLSIGQAGEFDYSGSQAIKALKEEGIYTVLINPNIATIQTSKGLADKVYFLPVTPEFVRKVILREKPDGIYVTFGGQTALS